MPDRPFNLQRKSTSAGPIPSFTRDIILDLLNELLNSLREVQYILAENNTSAISVDASVKLLEVAHTSLHAPNGGAEIKLPAIVFNIDAQLAVVYEWLADLLLKSQAIFVTPHRTIERFIARMHKAAESPNCSKVTSTLASSVKPPGTESPARRTVPFGEDVVWPGLHRTAISRLAAEEQNLCQITPSMQEADSDSPPGSEIIDESCFDDLSGSAKDNPLDKGIWSFAGHIPIEDMQHTQKQSRQTFRASQAAQGQRTAAGAGQYRKWVDINIPGPIDNTLILDRLIHTENAVDPAFHTADAYSNAARVRYVQRQVKDMNQQSRRRGFEMPPTDFPGSTKREDALLRQLKDASEGDNYLIASNQVLVEVKSATSRQIPRRPSFLRHKSIGEVPGEDDERRRNIQPADIDVELPLAVAQVGSELMVAAESGSRTPFTELDNVADRHMPWRMRFKDSVSQCDD